MRASSDSPAPAHLDTILALAPQLEESWPSRDEVARESLFGLTAMAEEEEEDTGGEDQPSPDDEHPQKGDQPADEGDEVPDFLSTYDLGDVPDEAKPVAEAAVKRLTAAYTKQRQEDTQTVREAQQAQLIVEGLQDPQRAPAILQALEVPIGEQEDEEFDFPPDPNERIDALQAELAQRDQLSQAEDVVKAENAYVTEQIEKLEEELQAEFTDDELSLLYMYADEYRDGEGNPDVGAAHKVLDAIASTAQQRLIKSKGRAPRRMGKGTAADRQVDLTNPEKRRAAMEQAAAAARASQ